MSQQLRCCVSLISIVNQHLENYLLGFFRNIWYEVCDANELLRLEVKFHVSCILLEVVQELLGRCSENLMDLVDLVKLVVTWKERKQG